jgi:hypothetical protein
MDGIFLFYVLTLLTAMMLRGLFNEGGVHE